MSYYWLLPKLLVLLLPKLFLFWLRAGWKLFPLLLLLLTNMLPPVLLLIFISLLKVVGGGDDEILFCFEPEFYTFFKLRVPHCAAPAPVFDAFALLLGILGRVGGRACCAWLL